MINTKTLYSLGIILVVIIAIIIGVETFSNGNNSKKSVSYFPGLKNDAIASVQIANDNDTVKVFRQGDIWMVQKISGTAGTVNVESSAGIPGVEPEKTSSAPQTARSYTADSGAVAQILEKISEMDKSILASRNPTKQEMFEVDSAHGTIVEIKDTKGKTYGPFRIGKNGPDWNSNYVRTMGSNDVWLTKTSIKGPFFSDISRWRDKTILKFGESSISKIKLSQRDTATNSLISFTVNRTTDSINNVIWSITEPEQVSAKADEANRIAQKLSKFNTDDWAETGDLSDSITGLGTPLLIAQVSLANGDTHELKIGKKQESSGKFFAKVTGKEETFLIYESSLNELKKKLEDLKAN